MTTKFYFCFLSLVFLVGCTTTPTVSEVETQQDPIAVDPASFLRMKWAYNVSFNAYMDPTDAINDGSNAPGGYYYNGGGSAGAAGVLAQIFIHSAIANSQQKTRYENLQKEANSTLTAYRDQLSKFSNSDLWDAVKSKDIGFKTFQEEDKSGVTVFEATPEFILSPDQKAIMLINQVEVFKSNDLKEAIYKNHFVVISEPIVSDDITSYWNNESPKGLAGVGADIFADSIELAKKDFNKELQVSDKQKTFRYTLGKKKMYEHGQLITDLCSNILMKNLRGYIYKIPVQKPSDHCDISNNTNLLN